MRSSPTNVSAGEVSVVLQGFSPADVRRHATRACERALGRRDSWHFTEEHVVSSMVSLGGRTRLYEGRFVASKL